MCEQPRVPAEPAELCRTASPQSAGLRRPHAPSLRPQAETSGRRRDTFKRKQQPVPFSPLLIFQPHFSRGWIQLPHCHEAVRSHASSSQNEQGWWRPYLWRAGVDWTQPGDYLSAPCKLSHFQYWCSVTMLLWIAPKVKTQKNTHSCRTR